MQRAATLLVVAVAASGASAAAAQQSGAERLGLVLRSGDSTRLAAAVRDRPADARDYLGQLIARAGTSRTAAADSILRSARLLASAYVAVWTDSFPVVNLTRFERMSVEQRAAKVAADSVRLAGNAAFGSKGVSAAIAIWRSALQRSAAIPDTAGMAAAMGNIGAGFLQASELDTADAWLTRARELAEAVGDRRTALNALGALGAVAKERGDLRRAQQTYVLALELRGRIGDVRGIVADHNNLGQLSADLGELADAHTHYDAALATARSHQLDEGTATALLNLGNLASVQGEYAVAAERYHEALALYRSLGSDADVALVLHDLGLLALRRGDYRDARARLVKARALFTRVGTVEDLVQIERDLAAVEGATGNLRGAVDRLRRAERLLVGAPKEHEIAAGVALARADLAVQLNTYAEADRHYARAQALYRRVANASGEAEARQGRSMLLIERKQYARALGELRTVLRSQVAAGDARPAALTRLVIGRAQQEQGDAGGARHTLTQALDTLHALGDAVAEAEALAALGDLELQAGAPLAAETHYRRGISRIQGRSVPTISWQLHAGLGRALRTRGTLTEAAAELRLAVGDVERMARSLTPEERRATFLADKWDAYVELALVERARGNVASAFAVSERMRARQMLDLLARGRVAPAATRDSALLHREQDLRIRIGELTERLEAEEGGVSTLRGPDLSGTSSGVTREALARAQEQYAQLLLELGDRGGALGPIVRGEVAGWRDVASRLRPGSAMLTYFVTDSTTMVFVVTPDTLRALDLDVSRGALTALIDFARGTMGRPQPSAASSAWRAPLRRLHQHLVAPVEDAGLLANVRQLVIVPNAELHYLPFAALIRRGDRDEYLIERYDIGYAPSASAWIRLGERGSSGSERVLALAPRAAELPGSREEVEAIRALYGRQATVLTNAAATEQTLRATAGGYGVVHLATYGVLNQQNPLFSFVQLSRGGEFDGRLEVHEVFGLALNAKLLVLSACQTALASGAVSDVPAGDDWVGLVRAFLGAGAQNVIATLWAVEDRSTARVMERLHRQLRAGESEVAALSRAQREMLRNSTTSSPFYWAGFVLVGGR